MVTYKLSPFVKSILLLKCRVRFIVAHFFSQLSINTTFYYVFYISGKLRKKVWINQGDIILVGLRDYQDAKADVILKYNPDEARNLKAYGELPEHAKINETAAFGEEEEDDNIEFDDVSGDEDIDDVCAI